MWCADVRRAARRTIVRRMIFAPCRRNTFLRRPVARRAAVTLFLAPATWRRAPPGIVTLFFASARATPAQLAPLGPTFQRHLPVSLSHNSI